MHTPQKSQTKPLITVEVCFMYCSFKSHLYDIGDAKKGKRYSTITMLACSWSVVSFWEGVGHGQGSYVYQLIQSFCAIFDCHLLFILYHCNKCCWTRKGKPPPPFWSKSAMQFEFLVQSQLNLTHITNACWERHELCTLISNLYRFVWLWPLRRNDHYHRHH